MFVFLLLPGPPVTSAEPPPDAGAGLCAEREVLLQTLVEAHGAVPNAASAILVRSGAEISSARAACNDGRVEAALAIYDRIIAELAPPAIDREATSAVGQAR
jgi:hypothetical protein